MQQGNYLQSIRELTMTITTMSSANSASISRTTVVWNVVLFQMAWFAAVLSAAHHSALLGMLAITAVVLWRLQTSAQPANEAKLLICALLMGALFETLNAELGLFCAIDAPPDTIVPAYWLIGLWGLLATTLNVSLRWLKRRYWLAALLGAVSGPLAYFSGARLGALELLQPQAALLSLAAGWAICMPLLMALSNHFDEASTRE